MRAVLRSTFVRWALASAALCFSIAAMFSIGLFVLPVGLALLVWATLGEQRPVPTVAGIAFGVGAILVVIGVINAGTDWGMSLLAAGIATDAASLAAGRWACRRPPGAPA